MGLVGQVLGAQAGPRGTGALGPGRGLAAGILGAGQGLVADPPGSGRDVGSRVSGAGPWGARAAVPAPPRAAPGVPKARGQPCSGRCLELPRGRASAGKGPRARGRGRGQGTAAGGAPRVLLQSPWRRARAKPRLSGAGTMNRVSTSLRPALLRLQRGGSQSKVSRGPAVCAPQRPTNEWAPKGNWAAREGPAPTTTSGRGARP